MKPLTKLSALCLELCWKAIYLLILSFWFSKTAFNASFKISNCSNFFGPSHVRSLLRQNPIGMQERGGWWGRTRWGRTSWAQTIAQAPSELEQLLHWRFLAIKEHKRRMNLNNYILAYAQVVHNRYLQIRLLFRHQHNFMFGRWSSASFVLCSKRRMSKMKCDE